MAAVRGTFVMLERLGWHDYGTFMDGFAIRCRTVKTEYPDTISTNASTYWANAHRTNYMLFEGHDDKFVAVPKQQFEALIKNRDVITTDRGDEIWVFYWGELGIATGTARDWQMPGNAQPKAKPNGQHRVPIGDSKDPCTLLMDTLRVPGDGNPKMHTVLGFLYKQGVETLTINMADNCFYFTMRNGANHVQRN